MKTHKLWQKGELAENELSKKVAAFTAGKDKQLDLSLAPYDVIGSIAHVIMLGSVKLISPEEKDQLVAELRKIYRQINAKEFSIRTEAEDIHSEIEFRLTESLGETGKKVHTGRSRNDQVLLDLKLFTRAELQEITQRISGLFNVLIDRSEQWKDVLMPGYTHLQVAMVSSFGLWLGAYAESLTDDMLLIKSAFSVANKNPLGSGAGYGGSLPINRKATTDLLGFGTLNYNSIYAQMNRGKMERTVTIALGSVAATLSRLAMDATLYMSQNFGFISFPEELTTGSSIMPHKKNPDVWELIRAKCNKIQALAGQFMLIQNNLPSGYHRDMQVIKEDYIPMFAEIKDCLDMTLLMLSHMQVNEAIIGDDKYKFIFTVEKVNELVRQGLSFREAYKKVGSAVENGTFTPATQINHTHEGSIGNLCNEEIRKNMNTIVQGFPFQKIEDAVKSLLING